MIGALRGTVMQRSLEGEVLLDVAGVGYEVHVPQRTMLDGEILLFTHLHVREDAMILFGFETQDEVRLFRLLIGTTGVGPKLALTLLSTFTPDQLRSVVALEDVDALVTVPGIGKRIAQRLMIELRNRLGEPETAGIPGGVAAGNTSYAEAKTALEGLGYRSEEIREALNAVDPSWASDVMVKTALRNLGTPK